MGLFNFFQTKSNDRNNFVSEKEFESNLAKQMKMTPQVLEQLRKYDVTEDKELKLEYFFYTNTNGKAMAFAKEIEKLNYQVQFGKAAGKSKHFIVTGWTTKMQMSETIVLGWVKSMCELGYKFDCEFDGWGANPE